ncbi:MAG: ABC transporter ATP-binding protein [Deltaproteobacteria bacterium]|nr:ABC transporter ATP-binding protein [Deltaproteobacteria bacterium]
MTHLMETTDLVTNFYTYEGVVKALNKVSIVVDHGSTFGLVGESGCGKSVFVRSIMRIVQEPGRIESGKILLFLDDNQREQAVDLLQQSEAFMQDLRGDKISMIFQEPNAALNPIMSIGEQVAESFLFHRTKELCGKVLATLDSKESGIVFPIKQCLRILYRIAADNPNALPIKVLNRIPLFKHWNRLLKKEAIKQSISIIAQLGIPNPDTIVKQYPHNLSGGMKQRIAIAIALACQPVLLIADEATSNLDVTIQAQILELLKELKQKEISSVLLITHDLGIVAETCDRVGVMYAGNLCEVADVNEIFRNPLHPYTKALLDSVPKLSIEGELKSIEGNVPNLVAPPSGCRFHPRCEHVMEACKKTFPSLLEVKQGHQVACYLFSQQGN